MIRYRAFRNGDPPRLAALWSRAVPPRRVVRPLGAHEFDAVVVGRVDFDPLGLIVAEDDADGRVVGYAHAGFGPLVGPEAPDPPTPNRLDRTLGTVAMMVVDPEARATRPEVGPRLLEAAEAYLKSRGALVIYAGGQNPLDPFYRAIYGGSEWAGILESHDEFRRIVADAGYQRVSTTISLDFDLAQAESRDPRTVLIRRKTALEIVEDAAPLDWWEATALGHTTISRFRLVDRADGSSLARASTWDMTAYGRVDGRSRAGLIGVEVDPLRRRQGFGRFLVQEILRHLRGHWGEVVSVATNQANTPALNLYQSIGFEPVDSSDLFRKPGG